MMGDEAVFPSLKDLAFEVFYKELLSKATHPSIVDFVRNCIHYQLMGTMRNTIREKCINKWNDGHPSKLIDSCTILDCVLDSSFTSTLEIKIPASSLYQSISKLISIIAHRSPKIYGLVVNVVNATAATSPTPPEDNSLEPIAAISNESRLRFLRSLVLENCSDSKLHPDLGLLDATHRSVLSLVGKCCPKLSQLTVTDFTITKKDIVGLILGELVDIVLPMGDKKWSEDSVLECLRVRPEFLTPLCSTLDGLELQNSQCVASAFAFALRHLSKLIYIESSSTIIKAIKILSRQQKVCSEVQQEFDQVCLEATSCINCESISIASPDKADKGHLSLSVLSYYRSENDGFEDLRAIRSMCPLLQGLYFNMIYSFRRMPYSKSVMRDLESTLSGWMLPSITLFNFDASSAPIVRSILNALAPSLKVLSFYYCKEIEMTPLAACNGLQDLAFNCVSHLHLEPNEMLSCWTSDNFLPSLNTFKSENCLGCANALFEGKSTLVSLTLHCCHIGTDGNNLVWSQIPELWPKLQHLDIGQCTGLSMAMIPELISRMGSLLRIGLPESVMLENPQLTRKVIQDLVNRELHPVKLYSSSLCSADEPCPFQRIGRI